MPRLSGVAWARACGLALVALLGACAQTPDPTPPEGLAYYWQSVKGHLALMRDARPVDDWLADPATAPALKDKLQTVQRMRRFAVDALHLPDNASYTRYAQLQRRAVVWNVVATPPFALTLQTWCFPVLGCVGYRGYFDEAEAEAFARQLREQGLEATVYPVPAYSTLGWTNWLGGDPLLSSFLGYPEGEVARLLFHELTHQLVYVADDTMFNESLATAVEQLGGERWLAQASPQAQREYAEFDARRQAFRALTADTRENLKQIYASALDQHGLTAPEKEESMRRQKAAAMARFRAQYQALKAGWGGHGGYDAWVARANNASFAVQASYDTLVPAFRVLFVKMGCQFPDFHAAVRQLATMEALARQQALQALASQAGSGAPPPSCSVHATHP
jgi:predicted aminopeptidase